VNGLASTSLYLRSGEQLEADDLRDLESYFEVLRAYYGIPDDQPVFPARERHTTRLSPSSTRPVKTTRATGRNRDDHPWRNTL
jgi:hypothetical protein